jgi:hypothetical protein
MVCPFVRGYHFIADRHDSLQNDNGVPDCRVPQVPSWHLGVLRLLILILIPLFSIYRDRSTLGFCTPTV